MKKEKLLVYESPSIEIIEVVVENGYVASANMEGWIYVDEW